MPGDAKLGLVVGVGLVMAIAVVFFRKDGGTLDLTSGQTSPASVPAAGAPPSASRESYRPTRGRATSSRDETTAMPKQHTVKEGETLASLARRYYGVGAKSSEIVRANGGKVTSAEEELRPGTVLDIPPLAPEEKPPIFLPVETTEKE